jgi:hypothetical protein
MDIYTPSSAEDLTTTEITEDGLMWQSIWDEDIDDNIVGSTVF